MPQREAQILKQCFKQLLIKGLVAAQHLQVTELQTQERPFPALQVGDSEAEKLSVLQPHLKKPGPQSDQTVQPTGGLRGGRGQAGTGDTARAPGGEGGSRASWITIRRVQDHRRRGAGKRLCWHQVQEVVK